MASSEPPGLPFAFHKFKNVAFPDGALDVSNEGSAVLLAGDQLYFHLGDTSTGPGSAQQCDNSGLNWFAFHVNLWL